MNESYRVAFPSKYIKASDLNGRRLIATISKVQFELVGVGGAQERKLVAHFREASLKPLVLNLVNSTAIAKVAGTDAYSLWAGTKVVLFPTETAFKGETVACVRVAAPKTTAAVQSPVPAPTPVDTPAPAEADEEVPDFGIEEIDAAVL